MSVPAACTGSLHRPPPGPERRDTVTPSESGGGEAGVTQARAPMAPGAWPRPTPLRRQGRGELPTRAGSRFTGEGREHRKDSTRPLL